jgi:beta-glucosidase
MYPFGYGLSYASFSLSRPVLAAAIIDRCGMSDLDAVATTVSCTVTLARPPPIAARGEGNGGGGGSRSPACAEVVQCYIRDEVSSVATPSLRLRAFARVDFAPGARAGEAHKVELAIRWRDLAIVDASGRWTVEPGAFAVLVGTSTRARDLEGVATLQVV